MTTTHDAQRAMKIFFKEELNELDRKEWFAITGQYDVTTKVLWDTIRASEGVAAVSASPQPSVDIKQKCINFICQNPYPAWDQLVELVESCFAAAPAQEPQESLVGKIVRVDNPRFDGYGFAQYDSGDRSRVIGVVLENGNTWEYAIETVRAALPEEISQAPKAVQARLRPAQEQPVEDSPQKYFCSNCLQYLNELEAMDTHDQSHDIVRVYHHPNPQKGKP